MSPMLDPIQKRQRIAEAKERRFTTTARILSGKNITTKVVDDQGLAPAWIDMSSLELTLNEAFPRAKNAVEALIYDRGKMYHEIDHVEFTTDMEHRGALAKRSKNAQAFLDLSNVLEDGRIERCGREKWEGTGDYLDALLSRCIAESKPDMIGGLVLYVRKKMFRNDKEKAYWQPFVGAIDKAIAADSAREALDIAFAITETIAEKAKEQTKGEGKEKGNGEGKSQGESDKTLALRPCQIRLEQGEGESQSDSGQKAGNGQKSGKLKGDETDGKLDDEVAEAIQEIVENAVENVKEEAKEEADAIIEEANESDDTTQQYADDEENMTADELSVMFDSLLVEQNRTRFQRSKEGMLNTLSLSNALTNRKCFKVRERAEGAPYVALVLDTSGSQRNRADELTKAARIIFGSLQKAKVDTFLVEYGHRINVIKTVPVDAFPCMGMTTETGLAMEKANDWLEEQGASRALMIIVTDGAPDDFDKCQWEKDRCEAMGGYVLGVCVGFNEKRSHVLPEMQWHDYTNVLDVSTLPEVLQPKLEQFIAGE